MNDKREFKESYYNFVGKIIVFTIVFLLVACLVPVIVKAL